MSLPGDAAIQQRVARIEGLIETLEAGADGPTRDAARVLCTALLGFHGAGLARIWDHLAEAGAPGRAVAEACARDDLVAALLSLHDLAPSPAPAPALVQLRTSRDAPARSVNDGGFAPKPPVNDGGFAPKPPATAPEVTFEPTTAAAVADAAAPYLSLGIRVRTVEPNRDVGAILLRCQVRIEPARRGLTPREAEALGDLFGDPSGHERTLKPMLWAHTGASVPAFTGETVVELPVPCTVDLALGWGRYLRALDGGEAPLILLFSGTVFWAREDGALSAEPIPWSREARFALPVGIVHEALESCYPGVEPLLVRREVVARLRRHRSDRCLTSWEEALESLLDAAGAS